MRGWPESLMWDFLVIEILIWILSNTLTKMGRRVGMQAAIIMTFTSRLWMSGISDNGVENEVKPVDTHAFQISRSTVIPSRPSVVIGACIEACGLTGEVRMSCQGRHIGSLHSGTNGSARASRFGQTNTPRDIKRCVLQKAQAENGA